MLLQHSREVRVKATLPPSEINFLPSYTIDMAIPVRAPNASADARASGVILAIDYGRKKLGLALSDEFQLTARPFATWLRTNRRRDLARLRELVRNERVSRIVVGLPLHLDGTASEMSEEAKAFASRVSKALGISVEMADERLSSWQAGETLAEIGAGGAKRRARQTPSRTGGALKAGKSLDDVAAAIFLRDYLERARVTQTGARP